MKKLFFVLLLAILLTACQGYHRPTPSPLWTPVVNSNIDFKKLDPAESRDIAGYDVTFQLESSFGEVQTFRHKESLENVCVGSTYLLEGTFFYREGVVEWREDCKTDYGGPGYRPVYIGE